LATIATLLLMVNDVPAVLAVTAKPPTKVAIVELQVTPNLVLSESSTKAKIWLFAVTAVVLTTIELDTALVGRATLPAAADAQTAGDAELEQLVAVPKVAGEPLSAE
jgi:hypothetical protein